MGNWRRFWLVDSALVLSAVIAAVGCSNTPIDVSNFGLGPTPLRKPSPGGHCDCYEDSLTGGQIFTMYCSYCHNAPTLAERPFASYRNVAAHMRVRANLTGKEHTKLMEFLRRWHDVPPPNPPLEPSPKRLIFSQPMSEVRKEPPAAPADTEPQPGAAPGPDGPS